MFVDTEGMSGRLSPATPSRSMGVTNSGGFAPSVNADTITARGRQAWPVAATLSLDELRAGGVDAQWVRISGVVRRVWSDNEKHVYFELRPAASRFYGQVPAFDGPVPSTSSTASSPSTPWRGHHQQPPADDRRAAVRADARAHRDRLAGGGHPFRITLWPIDRLLRYGTPELAGRRMRVLARHPRARQRVY